MTVTAWSTQHEAERACTELAERYAPVTNLTFRAEESCVGNGWYVRVITDGSSSYLASGLEDVTGRLVFLRCQSCGELKDVHSHTQMLTECGKCWDCYFWSEKVGWITDPHYADRVARIDGHHYVISPEDGNRGMRGFGGQRFVIAFNDGRQVTTTNLWHQGEMPAFWRERLPDNARFVAAEVSHG